MSSKSKKGGDGSGHQFKTGDLVLAKVSGYPYWPGMIVDSAPDAVMKQKRGSHNKIVRFIPDSNYGFCSFKELKPLHREDIEKYINDKTHTKGDLLEAYKTALNPDDWKREADEAELAAEQAQLEAAENEDELDDDAPAAKKRKSSSGKASGSKKGPGSKSKDGAKKADTGKKRKADGSAAGAKDDDKDDGSELDPASKKVKGWRHELQRSFLGKDGVLKESLHKSAEVFDVLEAYDEMTAKQLQDSKIIKVLKKICQLGDEDIGAEAESKHHFKPRSEKLMNKWTDILNAGSATAGDGSAPAHDAPTQDKDAPATSAAAEEPAKKEEPAKAEEPAKKDEPAAPAAPAAAEPPKPNGTAEAAPAPQVA